MHARDILGKKTYFYLLLVCVERRQLLVAKIDGRGDELGSLIRRLALIKEDKFMNK